MGTLTKLELEDEVRSGLGGRTDLDARLGRFLNLAQQRLARIHDFEEMQIISTSQVFNTGVDNDRFLTLPNVREVYAIVLLDGANSRKLIGRTRQYMDRIIPKPEYWARTWPCEYTLWGNTIEMFPLPSTTFDIRMAWTQWPLDLTDDDQASQFLQKDDILVELALAQANYGLGKEDTAKKHESRAAFLLAEAVETDRTKPDQNIVPAMSDIQALNNVGVGDPWNNPWIKDTAR